jgi:hypothetical protein
MPWKMNGDAIEVKDGNPVWVYEDTGKEIAVDGKQTFSKIAELTTKANERKQELDKLQETVAKYAGIEDPAAALKAMETMKSLDQKKLIDAGEVEKVKAETKSAMQKVIDDLQGQITSKDQVLNKTLVGGSFAKSKFIAENCVIPRGFIESAFSGLFKVEEGNVVAYDQAGNKIYSREKPGELADFDEAISTLISTHPDRDRILKAPATSGSGASGGHAGAGTKRMSLSDFNNLAPKERAAFMAAKGELTE